MSAASGHTPGPWEVVYARNGYPYQIRSTAASPHKPGGIVDVTRWASISLPSSAEGAANAALIASAPTLLAENAALRASNAEMLAALRKALLILTETFRWHRSTQSDAGRTIDAYNAMEAARAAIARATEAAS